MIVFEEQELPEPIVKFKFVTCRTLIRNRRTQMNFHYQFEFSYKLSQINYQDQEQKAHLYNHLWLPFNLFKEKLLHQPILFNNPDELNLKYHYQYPKLLKLKLMQQSIQNIQFTDRSILNDPLQPIIIIEAIAFFVFGFQIGYYLEAINFLHLSQ
ncbi:unnamed protein product [Paramecium sonneborni]|uniref:Transmembrane protein n=1 Tax=Paramecium sonneborni TaxID=65129 RepID=A0A8S1PXH2_9CILI|nr:unnamed protein product [Paramecium sonneborni]